MVNENTSWVPHKIGHDCVAKVIVTPNITLADGL